MNLRLVGFGRLPPVVELGSYFRGRLNNSFERSFAGGCLYHTVVKKSFFWGGGVCRSDTMADTYVCVCVCGVVATVSSLIASKGTWI